MERDPFDLFLEHCASEYDSASGLGKEGAREIAEDICPTCHDNVEPGSRFCRHCGTMQEVPDSVSGTFKPRTLIKRTLGVTLVAIERGYEIDGRSFTKAHIRIRNLSPRRVHISLTYVDSVLIDLTGRQYSPLDIEELPGELGDVMFPTWFYIYPDAYREGILLFRDATAPLQKAIVCAMHQENEDEMFTFELILPPSMEEVE